MNVALFSGSAFASDKIGTKVFRKGGDPKGVLVVQRKPVFRTGTFRDSMGIQSTWEGLHLDMMKSHFDMLKSRNILKDIPVRDGHPGWLMSGQEGTGKVIGWHTGLTVEEIEIEQGKFSFLLADYEITDPDAAIKEENGTYRNRSSEIGEYTTNDEATFWPTYLGVAMVDFSAVEGLNFSKYGAEMKDPEGRVFHVFMDEKEAPPVGANDQQTVPPVVVPVVPVAPPAIPPAVQLAAQVTPQAFTVNGQATTDFAAVQAHIATLEGFRDETISSGIEDFVNGLAAPGVNKILATQIPEMVAWAKTLSSEQFAAWKKTQETVPAHPIVGQVFGVTPTTDGTATVLPAAADIQQQYDTAVEQVKMHTQAGTPQAKIEKLPSWAKMKALEPQVQALKAQS